jgi:hypothetical protein
MHAMQKRILDQTWESMGLPWTRAEVRSVRMHNYEPQPSHRLPRRLEDVWLTRSEHHGAVVEGPWVGRALQGLLASR